MEHSESFEEIKEELENRKNPKDNVSNEPNPRVIPELQKEKGGLVTMPNLSELQFRMLLRVRKMGNE